MGYVIIWYFVFLILGWISFPLTFKIFPFLVDRGFSISRVFGLLLWAYIFWISVNFGLVPNSFDGAFFSLCLLICLSFFVSRNLIKEITEWVKKNKRVVLLIEGLFLFAFIAWSIFRGANADISGTEKPMELAFISAILRSPIFPPNDPWLSGYSISYYHFGYVMVAMLAHFTMTLPEYAFNLALISWFGMTATACYGVVLNLVNIWQMNIKSNDVKRNQNALKGFISSLLGPFFLLIISNIEGFLEMLHSGGLFWRMDQNGRWYSHFWKWLKIQELTSPPSTPFTFIPSRVGGIWWWRASRVLQDFDIAGESKEIIDEFPFFSYMLGDLHPHVLAMPFFLLALLVGLNVYKGGLRKYYSTYTLKQWLKSSIFWISLLICGGLAFLNTWDLPVILGIMILIVAYIRSCHFGWNKNRLLEVLIIGVVMGVGCLLLYMPFFIGFSSQAGGFLPSMNFFTRGVHFWIMFLPFLLPIMIFLLWHKVRADILSHLSIGITFALLLLLLLFLFSYFLVYLVATLPFLLNWMQSFLGVDLTSLQILLNSLTNTFLSLQGTTNINELVRISLQNRIAAPFTTITLVVMIALVLSSLHQRNLFRIPLKERTNVDNAFPLLLIIFMGALLCLIPEYFYLRDVFGTRMNTIFKFYFQTWTLWAVVSAAAIIILVYEAKKITKFISIIILLVILMGLAYPFWGIYQHFMGFNFNNWNLDGLDYLKRYNPDEYEAIQWLREADYGYIAEAVGGSYSGFARISMATGLPTVLGWPGHELQWRGGVTEIGSREADIDLLFSGDDWMVTQRILDQYQIRYVYIGNFERSSYSLKEQKFQEHLVRVFSNTSIVIYEYKRV